MLEHLKRHSIRADAYFLVPAFLLFSVGMALAAWKAVEHERETGVVELSLSLPGLGLVVLGLVLALSGAFTLGRNYSSSIVIRHGHRLVQRGVYRVVRHPIYLGVLLVSLGIPAATGAWIALVPMMMLIPLFVYRMGIEERLLIEEFGDEYRAYMARTKRLVPFLY